MESIFVGTSCQCLRSGNVTCGRVDTYGTGPRGATKSRYLREFKPHCPRKVNASPVRYFNTVSKDSAWKWWSNRLPRAWDATFYFKKELNSGRGGHGWRWWASNGNSGPRKTRKCLHSDIAGTALSTTRLVDWLLLTLLNSLLDFHLGLHSTPECRLEASLLRWQYSGPALRWPVPSKQTSNRVRKS